MAASTTDAKLLRNVRAFAKALTAVRPVPISIPGTRPKLVGDPLGKDQVKPANDDEDFPELRRKHEYRFLLKEGPLDVSVQLFANTRGHWRLFAFRKQRSILSLNLTLAHDDGEPVWWLQQRLKLTNYAMSPEDRLRRATEIANQLQGFGLKLDGRDILFPGFDTRSGRFIDSTAATFIRDFVVAAVVKGHYMENKGYELPGFDVRVSRQAQMSGFDPGDVEDARQRALADVVRRPGQSAFRDALLKAYEGRCAVTGCNFTGTLEAAHVTPHMGVQTDLVENGLLLRADIHMLFDRGLLTVDSKTMKVCLAPVLRRTVYKELEGKVLAKRKSGTPPLSLEALDLHRSNPRP